MDPTKENKSYIDEFKDFVKFLQTLWGVLAGISVFFPLSNVLLKVIPLDYITNYPPGALMSLSPTLITTLSTIATLFIILMTFRQRDSLRTKKQRGTIQRQAWIAFGLGVVALIFYFMVYIGIYGVYYEPNAVFRGDPRGLVGDFLLLLSYGTFFSQITRAFVLLGMLEYFNTAK